MLFSNLRKNFVIFFAVIGPGIITAVANNDAAGIATYSVSASIYGYASRFLLPLEILLLAVTQEIGARVAIVTKKGLGDLIRERLGLKWSIVIFLLLFLSSQGVVLQEIAGLKAALSLFGLPYQIFLPGIIFAVWIFLLKGNYDTIQKGFLLLAVFYFAYFFSAVQSNPDYKLALINTVYPTDTKVDLPYLFARIAVLGTTITAWGQFFIHSYVRDKGIGVDKLKYEKAEVYLGSFITNFVSFMIMLAVAGTLYQSGVRIDSAEDAAIAIKPFAGDLAFILFSYGLFTASILGAAIVPLATAYAFSEFFGFERRLDKSFSQSKIFYGFLIVQLFLGFFIALLPNLSLFNITLYANFLNGAVLPVIFFFLIKFANDVGIMGNHRNTLFDNVVLIGSTVLITLAVVITFVGHFLLRIF